MLKNNLKKKCILNYRACIAREYFKRFYYGTICKESLSSFPRFFCSDFIVDIITVVLLWDYARVYIERETK